MYDLNKTTYESDDIVYEYLNQGNLQKPETTILKLLKDKLTNYKMLDIGIGGGRTTKHFASLVKEYLGIDYSKPMIEACKRNFVEKDNIEFKVLDARILDGIADQHYDFVLFSYNGLDYVTYEDRVQVLKEMKRVLKSGGIFVFSLHNLYNLKRLYNIRLYKNPFFFAKKFYFYTRLIKHNGFLSKYKDKNWAIINDGVHNFKNSSYYTRPEYQIVQLSSLGFGDIKLYDMEGTEICEPTFENINIPWIYYYCRKF